ncbi:MAG: glycosyltransferase WbuB [Burkholderiales bacterium]|nr:MAG: glycosyltransferase WbuB [Burkholderiales bacterium]
MHILFLTDNFPPEVNAPASRTFEHCREWVAAGQRVTVITCAPNFPKGEVFGGYRNRIWQTEDMSGIRVIRVWTYISRNEGFGRRILDYLSYMLTAFIASFFVRRVDVIIGTSPQFFTACAAFGVSLFKRKPWLFELRDLWPESIGAVGAIRKQAVLDALERLELFLYRKADAVVSVTHAFKENLIARGIPAGKIHVVTNGVDTSRFTPQPRDEALAERLGTRGYFTAGYIGTHGMAHGLNTLINAAAILQNSPRGDRVRLLLLGDGAQRRALQERAIAMALHNIVFVDSVPKDEVVRYWSLLDTSIIHLKKSDLFKTVIPSKMFECMGMRIPILHGVEGESAEIIQRYEVGLTFEPENAFSLIERLYELHDSNELRQRLSGNGPRAAAAYDRRNLAQAMLEIVEKLAVQSTSA